MKPIETQILEPVPERKGCVRVVAQRKAKDVFEDIEKALKEAGLYPDEYFKLAMDYENADFPEPFEPICYAQWGASEGIYIEINLRVYDEIEKHYVTRDFATGKTLNESTESYDRMQYIAGYIYRLLTGDNDHAYRYIPVERRGDIPDYSAPTTLAKKIKREYLMFVRDAFMSDKHKLEDVLAEIGVRSLIVSEFDTQRFQSEDIEALLMAENALDVLVKKSEKVFEEIMFDIRFPSLRFEGKAEQ